MTKIKFKKQSVVTDFDNLPTGECILYEGNVYMRCDDLDEENTYVQLTGDSIGRLYYFKYYDYDSDSILIKELKIEIV